MNEAYSKALGLRMKSLRLEKGLTQEQLAAQLQLCHCDLTRSALAKIEVGQRQVYPHELKAFQKVFKLPYEDILP